VRALLRRAATLALPLSLAGATLPRPVAAHLFAPALLELREVQPGRVEVRWKQPAARVQGSSLRPVLPGDCSGIGRPVVDRDGTGFLARWEIACPNGLIGKTIGVEGLAESQTDALLRVTLADGRLLRTILTAEQAAFVVSAAESKLAVGRGYTALGVEHILSGWDHLSFVLGLVLLVGWGSTLPLTIGAFAVGHSITLALASLGIVSVRQQPMDAAIALSTYLIAIELVRSRAGRTMITRRAAWLVAGAFGLLHGLGFAGALADVGLPQGEIPLALFSFNVGIELGQLAFVAVVLLAIAALQSIPRRWPDWAGAIPAYGIGSLAIYWFLARLA
jgi:HupE / UreJ protein